MREVERAFTIPTRLGPFHHDLAVVKSRCHWYLEWLIFTNEQLDLSLTLTPSCPNHQLGLFESDIGTILPNHQPLARDSASTHVWIDYIRLANWQGCNSGTSIHGEPTRGSFTALSLACFTTFKDGENWEGRHPRVQKSRGNTSLSSCSWQCHQILECLDPLCWTSFASQYASREQPSSTRLIKYFLGVSDGTILASRRIFSSQILTQPPQNSSTGVNPRI